MALPDYPSPVRPRARLIMAAVRRVRSIVFVHDGSEYTATVGEPIRQRRYSTDRGKASYGVTQPETTTDDWVAEIRPGEPTWLVFLDRMRSTGHWENPFMVGLEHIRDTTYFKDQE
jgi:hypothetical protein